jgi:hypothetical protein
VLLGSLQKNVPAEKMQVSHVTFLKVTLWKLRYWLKGIGNVLEVSLWTYGKYHVKL